MSGKAPKAKTDPRSWDAPYIPEWMRSYASSMGYRKMTAVQASCVPQFLEKGTDVVVEAVTGSGKTLAYLVPTVKKVLGVEDLKRHHVAAIIVSPTRELAAQIHSVLLSLLAFHEPSAALLPYLQEEEKRPNSATPAVVPQLLVGGTTTPAQDLSFFMRHSPNLLIATPGRLVELLSSPYVHCKDSAGFEVLILDEADRLLDLGFKQDIQRVLSHLPKQRRTGLFSASVSEAVSEIIRVGLRNPVKITVRVKNMKDGGIIEDRKVPASLQMSYLAGPASHKLPLLCQLLEKLQRRPQRTMIFLSTCAAVDYFQHVLPMLLPEGFSLLSLHGKHLPKVREKNFNRFLTCVSPTILLTTDVAARGLDFPSVDLVIQVDPPSDTKAFIHRCGRAGRAGRKGLAVVLLHEGREEEYVSLLAVRQTPITLLEDPAIAVSAEDAAATTERIRKMLRADRALQDKAQRAFVSWVRSYGSHQAASIFRVADLDWTDLGNAWGLLRLPRMPELKSWEGDKHLGQEIDWDNFAYKDKAREAQRKEEIEALKLAKANGETNHPSKKKRKNEAWSAKEDKNGVRAERREKRRKKKEAEAEKQMTEEEKLKKMELNELIEQVRRKNAAKGGQGEEEEFAGFDD
ncbi:related to RNA helicase SPB4 [Cephalotrichum gorgonifer]|uniref:ATP-dependent RNA helicase n=1 Tax=Cephalotrichum gorgonifer TaxID=2041049 RepID=A0AAE8N216_9PEZI|nr:related to RNA helicase SPB4 [Cephalotrichum gorgonifer]